MGIVEMTGITKRFPGATRAQSVLANDQVNLELHKGEIHGLLGENGAGKTTLMNILFGLYQPDAGQILVRDQLVTIASPAAAIHHGIGMVHQHFRLVPPLTVTENIILGLEGRGLLDLRAARQRVQQVAEEYGIQIDPDATVQDLSVGQQQRVEILSSLYRGAEILILDEPTAVLTPQEADSLVACLRTMAEQGKTIVFISHKLEEAMRLTDRVTVLRAGRVVFEALTRDTDKAQLAREMIGRDLIALRAEQRNRVLVLAGAQDAAPAGELAAPRATGKVMLEARAVHVNDDRGLPAVRGLSLALRSGEILGIAGVDGNGQRELAEAIVCLRPLQAGQLVIAEEDASHWGTHDFLQRSTGYIPDDRQNDGLILGFDLARNATLKLFRHRPFSAFGFLHDRAISQFTVEMMEDFDVRAPSPFVRASTLSGGNQQKLILARELSQTPRLIIASQPARGLDIGATAYVHQRLMEERDRGGAILLISTDLDEIMLLSDRILVMYNGQSMGELDAYAADAQTLGLMMAGTPLGGAEGAGGAA